MITEMIEYETIEYKGQDFDPDNPDHIGVRCVRHIDRDGFMTVRKVAVTTDDAHMYELTGGYFGSTPEYRSK